MKFEFSEFLFLFFMIYSAYISLLIAYLTMHIPETISLHSIGKKVRNLPYLSGACYFSYEPKIYF